MSKGEQTRRIILDRAFVMASEIGLESVSIGSLAEATGLSKSGLFAHFKSKEALQLDVLQELTARFISAVMQPALAAPRGEPRVRVLFDRYLQMIAGDENRRGCLLQKLSTEYAGREGPIRDRVIQLLKDWNDALTRSVKGAIDEGHFRADLDAAAFTYEILGIAMVYQQSWNLLRHPKSRAQAQSMFDALLSRSRA